MFRVAEDNVHDTKGRIWLLAWQSCSITFILLVMGGCAATPIRTQPVIHSATVPIPLEESQGSSNYQLHRGDALEIKFFHTPELNENVTVRPDGKISLQLIGEIVVVGMSAQDLTEKLRELYATTLVAPEISVLVRSFAGQKAFVGGEVSTPGLVSFDGPPTLLQALIQVGWIKRSAQLQNVVIVRNSGSSRPDVLFVDVQQWLEEPEQTPPVLLQPFDVVYVPKTRVAKVNDFIQQYIDDPILTPLSRLANFSFFYDLRGVNVDAGLGSIQSQN